MNRTLRPLCFLCLGIVFAGCGQKEYTGVQRFPLSGRVTYDGQPIDVGSISFLPQSASQRVSGGSIENGTYSVPEARGANAGTHRIEIRWQKLTGKKVHDPRAGELVDERAEGLPPKFHTDSELTAEVPSPSNTYDFDLK